MQLPEWFRRTKIGQEIAAEAAAIEQDERAQLVSEIARVREEAGAKFGALDAAVVKTRVALDKAARAHATAREDFGRAEEAARTVRASRDSSVSRLEARLRLTCDAAIASMIEGLADEWEKTRRVHPERVNYGQPIDDNRNYRSASNYGSIVARMDACRAAMKEAETLKLLALPATELAARLDRLRASLPAIQPAVSFIPAGERPAGGIPVSERDHGPKKLPWVHGGPPR